MATQRYPRSPRASQFEGQPRQTIGSTVDENGVQQPTVHLPLTQDHDWSNFDRSFSKGYDTGGDAQVSQPQRIQQQAQAKAGGFQNEPLANPVIPRTFQFGPSKPVDPNLRVGMLPMPAQPTANVPQPAEPNKWAPVSTSTGKQQLMPSESGNRMVPSGASANEQAAASVPGFAGATNPQERGNALRAATPATSVGETTRQAPQADFQGMTVNGGGGSTWYDPTKDKTMSPRQGTATGSQIAIDPKYGGGTASVRFAKPGEANTGSIADNTGTVMKNGVIAGQQAAPTNGGPLNPVGVALQTPGGDVNKVGGLDAGSQPLGTNQSIALNTGVAKAPSDPLTGGIMAGTASNSTAQQVAALPRQAAPNTAPAAAQAGQAINKAVTGATSSVNNAIANAGDTTYNATVAPALDFASGLAGGSGGNAVRMTPSSMLPANTQPALNTLTPDQRVARNAANGPLGGAAPVAGGPLAPVNPDDEEKKRQAANKSVAVNP